jgi:hypothetical protein
VLTWTLPSALLGNAAGGRFRILANWFFALSTSAWLRWRLRYNALTIWQSEEFQADVTIDTAIRDMGVIQLPPWLVDSDFDVADIDLELRARLDGGGNIFPDFFQLTPTDSYRVLIPVAYGVAYEQRLIDDGILNMTYVDSGADTGRYGYYAPRGMPVYLWPSRDQRLYFLMTSWIGDAEIDRTIAVRIYYRPRRLTL